MQIILWLLKYEELLVFFVFYHFKLITLTFGAVIQTKQGIKSVKLDSRNGKGIYTIFWHLKDQFEDHSCWVNWENNGHNKQ